MKSSKSSSGRNREAKTSKSRLLHEFPDRVYKQQEEMTAMKPRTLTLCMLLFAAGHPAHAQNLNDYETPPVLTAADVLCPSVNWCVTGAGQKLKEPRRIRTDGRTDGQSKGLKVGVVRTEEPLCPRRPPTLVGLRFGPPRHRVDVVFCTTLHPSHLASPPESPPCKMEAAKSGRRARSRVVPLAC